MKIDLHVHTSEVSLCGQLPAKEVVRLYKEAGYDAIVITNHFNNDTACHYERHGQKDFYALYMDGYRLAKEAGEALGLTVLFGYEIRFTENINDYLVFGMPDELAMDYMRLFAMKPKEFSALANENGFLFYQAHPFRNGMTVCRPDILYGIEVHNGHPGHDSRNDIALEWAEKYGLHKISGSDCHFAEGVGKAGIITREDILTDDPLVNVLKSGNYELI